MDLVPGYISSFLHSLLWAISSVGLGSVPGRSLKTASRLESLVVHFLLGCVAWILICLLLALFHVLRPGPIVGLVYVIGAGSLVLKGREWWSGLRAGLGFDWRVLTLAIIMAAQLTYTFMPVLGFDATCYHLPLARHMLDKGTILWTPFIFNSAFPKGYEILQAIGLAIGGDVAASQVSWWFSVATVLTVIAIGNRIGSRAIGLWAGIAVSLTPLWFELSFVPKNEVGMAFGIVLLVLAMIMRAPGWFVGLVVGWLSGCKYYGMEIGCIGLAIWLIQVRPGRRSALWAVGTAFLVAGFWYVRNAWLFANPVFPYFHELCVRSGFHRAAAMQGFAWDVYGQFDQFASPRTLYGWLSAPFRLLLDPEPDFIENRLIGWGWVGWLAFPWPLAILTALKRRRELLGPYVFVLAGSFSWVVIHGIIYLRFLAPLLAMMFLLSFVSLNDWFSFLKPGRRFAALATAMGCVLAIAHLLGPTTYISLARIPLSSEERDLFLERNFCGWQVIRELNEIDPPPVVYYLYGEAARYYCEFPLYAGWRDPYGFDKFHQHATSGAELARWLEEIGVDILVVNQGRSIEGVDAIMDVLLGEDFTAVYRLELLTYYSTSVFVRRDLDIHFYIEQQDQ